MPTTPKSSKNVVGKADSRGKVRSSVPATQAISETLSQKPTKREKLQKRLNIPKWEEVMQVFDELNDALQQGTLHLGKTYITVGKISLMADRNNGKNVLNFIGANDQIYDCVTDGANIDAESLYTRAINANVKQRNNKVEDSIIGHPEELEELEYSIYDEKSPREFLKELEEEE